MRHPLMRTLIAGAAVLAVAAVGAPAAQAASGSVAWEGPGDVTCSAQVKGNDGDPTKSGAVEGVAKPGLGKIEPGTGWTAGQLQDVSVGFSADWKTVTVEFGPDFDADAAMISQILIKGGNGYAVCTFDYYFEAGDSVTLTTAGLLLNNGKQVPAISHVSFYQGGDDKWRPSDPTPVCEWSEYKETVALTSRDGVVGDGPWFAAVEAVPGTSATLYAGQNTAVGTVLFTAAADGSILATYTITNDGYTIKDVAYKSATSFAGLGKLNPGAGNGNTLKDYAQGAVVTDSFTVPAGDSWVFLHLKLWERGLCTVG